MSSYNEKVNDLKEYLKNGFFNSKFYSELTIIPYNENVRASIEQELDKCISELIKVYANNNQIEKTIQNILQNGLNRFDVMEYDTEDAEFICLCFEKIAKIMEINFGNELNQWLYGDDLGSLI